MKLLQTTVQREIFGSSAAIGRNILLVGAQYDNHNGTNSGSAYLFDTTTGQQIEQTPANDGAAFDVSAGPLRSVERPPSSGLSVTDLFLQTLAYI